MEVLIQSKPPIDFGFGVHDNFRTWKLSLIFFDLLINVYPNRKSILIGFGCPFLAAIVFSFNSENTEGVSTTSRTESGVSHDVSDRNASRGEPTKESEVVVEGALALRTDTENICDHHWERVSRYNWSNDWRYCCKCEKWEQI